MKFQAHQKRWFIGAVGKTVFREATPLTPARIRETLIQQIKIENEGQAASSYLFHKDYQVNYSIIN